MSLTTAERTYRAEVEACEAAANVLAPARNPSPRLKNKVEAGQVLTRAHFFLMLRVMILQSGQM